MVSVVLLLLALAARAAVDEYPVFEDAQPAAGLNLTVVSGGLEKDFLVEAVGGGLAAFDYDNDGWVDLYVVNGGTIEGMRTGVRGLRNALFRNNGDGTFTDVTAKAGVPGDHWGKGALAVDLDNDGHRDLYVSNFGPNILYRNNGDGTFTDVTRQTGTGDPHWSSAAAAADFDADGDLDLFLANYLEHDPNNLPVEGKFCSYRSIPVSCGPRGLRGARDRLYRNDGNWTFTEVAEQVGMGDDERFYGLGAAWGDFDNDGDPDLYIANDSNANYLYRNEGNSSFTEIGAEAGVAYSEDGREQAGMGTDWGDFDNDGWLDLIVTNFSHDYNTIYRNTGNGFFLDVSYDTGLAQDTYLDLSWGTGFWDLNNDGLKDLFISNGHIYPQLEAYGLNLTYRQKNKLFLNKGNGEFENLGSRAGAPFSLAKSSRGAAFADFNNDGRIDIALVEYEEVPSLLINRSQNRNHWLMVKLHGSESNLDGIGSRVTVKTESGIQIKEVRAGASYASTNDYRAHFGLGRTQLIDELRVRWPSGKETVLREVQGDQFIEIREEDGGHSTLKTGNEKTPEAGSARGRQARFGARLSWRDPTVQGDRTREGTSK